MQAEFGLHFPLIQAFGEDVPLPDESFDLAYSGYGASLFADPYRWTPGPIASFVRADASSSSVAGRLSPFVQATTG